MVGPRVPPYTAPVDSTSPPLGPAPGRDPRQDPALSRAQRRMLDRLRDQPEPVTLAALVRSTGLHENTLREHLDALLRAGLVQRERSAPQGRGRPAWRYRATDTEEPSEYAGLARALATGLVRSAPDPETAVRAATEAGEAWGRELARGAGADGTAATEPDGGTRTDGTATTAPDGGTPAGRQVIGLLDELGFGTDVGTHAGAGARQHRPEEVRLTRCPLLQAAVEHPDVVCAVHLGIVRGALEEHGADPTGTELHPFSEPGACRLVLPQTTRSGRE